MSSRFYNSSGKEVYNGDVIEDVDLNDVNTAIDTGFQLVESEVDNIGTEHVYYSELSRKWAEEAEDVEVTPGHYSSYHYSQKSEDNNTSAASSASAASASETNAASSASAASADATQTALDRVSTTSSSSSASASEVLANKWAEEAEDVEVTPGEYSAHHWAIKAASGASVTSVSGTIDEVDVDNTTDPQVPKVSLSTTIKSTISSKSDTAVTTLKDSDTGGSAIPAGTTAQRGTASAGKFRFNTDDVAFEGYDGSAWSAIGGGGGGLVWSQAPSNSETGVAGEGLLFDTSSTLSTFTLPTSPSEGDSVGVGDGSGDAGEYRITVTSTDTIMGLSEDFYLDSDNQSLIFSYINSNWAVTGGMSSLGVGDSSTLRQPMMHVQDQKPTGTDGGNSVVGDNPRDLNTILTNEIVGASLSSNAVTLPAGEYWVEASSIYGSQPQALLIKVEGVEKLRSVSGRAYGTTDAPSVCGKISITSTSEIKVHAYVINSEITGLGIASNIGVHEVYTDFRIWKLDSLITPAAMHDTGLYPLAGNAYVTDSMYGLEYTRTGDHTISVNAGNCMDSLNITPLVASALQTVTIGSTINEIYNLFLCDDGVVRTDTDVNGTTLLAGTVSQLRWIGFVKTDASGIITRFTMVGKTLFFETFSGATFLSGIGTTMLAVDESPVIPVSRIENITYGAQSNTDDAAAQLGDMIDSARYGAIRTYSSQSDVVYPWAWGTSTDAQNEMQPIGQVKSVRMNTGTGEIAVRGVTMKR